MKGTGIFSVGSGIFGRKEKRVDLGEAVPRVECGRIRFEWTIGAYWRWMGRDVFFVRLEVDGPPLTCPRSGVPDGADEPLRFWSPLDLLTVTYTLTLGEFAKDAESNARIASLVRQLAAETTP